MAAPRPSPIGAPARVTGGPRRSYQRVTIVV